MANTTADKTPISLDNLARNNERMKEYIQGEIDKVPSYSEMTGATSDTNGASGLVPAPTVDDISKFLRGDGTWANIDGGSSGGNADNIDGIPVDLTGIYNNQVIGYDEEQGKLVPMASGTSRTEAILPSYESTAIWTFVSTENCTVKESEITVPYVNVPNNVDGYKFKVRFNRAYLLSDFSNLAIEYGKGSNCTCYIRLSKTADFSVIDAEYKWVAPTIGNGNSNNISSLMGKFYIEVELINTTPANSWNSIKTLKLS